MISKTCAKCGRLIAYGKRYCDSCRQAIDRDAPERKRESDRRYNRKRNKEELRFYASKDWKLLSAGYMREKGWRCERCGGIATEVHHIVPIQSVEGWNRRLDYDNLEALCIKCHNDRHGRFGSKK